MGTFGHYIRERRVAIKLRLGEVAEVVGVAIETLMEMENSRLAPFAPWRLRRLARVLKVDPEELVAKAREEISVFGRDRVRGWEREPEPSIAEEPAMETSRPVAREPEHEAALAHLRKLDPCRALEALVAALDWELSPRGAAAIVQEAATSTGYTCRGPTR